MRSKHCKMETTPFFLEKKWSLRNSMEKVYIIYWGLLFRIGKRDTKAKMGKLWMLWFNLEEGGHAKFELIA